jgi:hypothetical protein
MAYENCLDLNTKVMLDSTLPPHHEAGCGSGPRKPHHDHHHCPLPSPVTHRGMGRMAAVITLPCIRVQDRAMPWDILGDQVSACAPVREPCAARH